MGTIQEVQLKAWQAGKGPAIIIPQAVVKTRSGKLEVFDLRTTTKWSNVQVAKCTQVSNVQFCTSDDVAVIPDYYSGSRTPVAAKVLIVADILGLGLSGENNARMLSLYKNAAGVDVVTATSPGLAKEGSCFGKTTTACIGQKYNNGLRSVDEIVAYLPLNDEFIIRAGDLNSLKSVSSEILAKRMTGEYRINAKMTKTNVEKAALTSKRDIENAKKRVLAEAIESCSREFLGQGNLDPKTMNPKVTNCSRYVDKGGFSHGFYRPSLGVRCNIDFSYTCLHKLQQ